jgi:hypothetical protein
MSCRRMICDGCCTVLENIYPTGMWRYLSAKFSDTNVFRSFELLVLIYCSGRFVLTFVGFIYHLLDHWKVKIVLSYVMATYLVMFLISHHSLCGIAGSCRLCCRWEQQVYTGWAYYLPEFHREGSRGWYGGGWVIYIFLQIKLSWVLNL